MLYHGDCYEILKNKIANDSIDLVVTDPPYDFSVGLNGGGFMVKDDVEEFSQKTLELLQNESLHKEKSEQALEWGSKWKISYLTPKLIECYQKAIGICKERESK